MRSGSLAARSERPRRTSLLRLGAGLALGIGVLVVLWYFVTQPRQQPFVYWVIDEGTLGVELVSGPAESYSCSIARTSEAGEQVQIFAGCREPIMGGAGPSVGIVWEFTVRLETPLGERRVVDGLGNPARVCDKPRCGRQTSQLRTATRDVRQR